MSRTPELSDEAVRRFAQIREDFTRMMLGYRFGMEQVATRLDILREEFTELHQDNPIEHISTRLKSPESIMAKAARQGVELEIEALRGAITDIAGIRVVCPFVADVYRLVDSLTAQPDITVRTVKDYIADPKPNGYRSLHVILEIPVFLSSGAVQVPVEVQFRTVAMDFWASTEHKIFYKYQGAVPAELRRRITEAASTAARMDEEMADLLRSVHGEAESDHARSQTRAPRQDFI
ncbi:GTP pyrophosphokinase [Janibacter cremeus]|uniref:Putative GTP pyrophosphokinase n=1 Tax=Janibacter cremeus TaxID=1285192 RepID=A0A852VRA2_9MICO|nr:GTP pyrophosphokinase family protein [Janibacter cremeus]NYF98358.1 putative GTP pyrophosphokinase [Janibacter cremeus]